MAPAGTPPPTSTNARAQLEKLGLPPQFGDAVYGMIREEIQRANDNGELLDKAMRDVLQSGASRLSEGREIQGMIDVVKELVEGMKRVEGRVEVIEQDVAGLRASVGRLEEGQAKLEEGQAKLEEGQRSLRYDVNEGFASVLRHIEQLGDEVRRLAERTVVAKKDDKS